MTTQNIKPWHAKMRTSDRAAAIKCARMTRGYRVMTVVYAHTTVYWVVPASMLS